GRMKYFLSGSYFGQDGVALGSRYDRAAGRANIDVDPTERLSLSASLSLTRETNHRVVGDNTIVGVVANSNAEQPNDDTESAGQRRGALQPDELGPVHGESSRGPARASRAALGLATRN